MSAPVESNTYGDAPEVESKGVSSGVEHAYDLDLKAEAAAYKADAVEAENMEHNMGVWEAVKAYPMASFWAFVMSSTIVCSYLIPELAQISI